VQVKREEADSVIPARSTGAVPQPRISPMSVSIDGVVLHFTFRTYIDLSTDLAVFRLSLS